jgi:hypothetical protein
MGFMIVLPARLLLTSCAQQLPFRVRIFETTGFAGWCTQSWLPTVAVQGLLRHG